MIPVTLREAPEDPNLLPQADLIAGLAPRLKKLTAADGLSAAGDKDYARGVTEFLEKRSPERAILFFTKVIHQDASCLPCRTMLAVAELDLGDWDGAYRNLADVFNKIMADHSLGRPEPLVALGVMESWKHNPKNAAAYFIEALKYAPQDVLALQELGRSQLLLRNWAAADDYLGKALAAGAKPEIRLLRIEALLGEDQFQAADQEMARYLEGRDVKKMPLAVRALWMKIDNRKKIEADYGKAKSKGEQALDYLHHPPLDIEGLEACHRPGTIGSHPQRRREDRGGVFRQFPEHEFAGADSPGKAPAQAKDTRHTRSEVSLLVLRSGPVLGAGLR